MRVLKSGRFGLLVGATSAVILSLIMVVWEVVENPGGIFRSAEGINWDFVFATAESWLVPALIPFVVISFTGHLIVAKVRASKAKR